MDDAITEDGSADRLFLLMLYTGARAMDGPDDRDVALADSVSSHGTRGCSFVDIGLTYLIEKHGATRGTDMGG